MHVGLKKIPEPFISKSIYHGYTVTYLVTEVKKREITPINDRQKPTTSYPGIPTIHNDAMRISG